MHPLQGGILRLINRHERRSSLPIEPAWRFYPALVWDFVSKHVKLARHAWRIYRVYRRVAADPNGHAYIDQSMIPVTDEDLESNEMFTQNDAARHAVEHARKVKELTHSSA